MRWLSAWGPWRSYGKRESRCGDELKTSHCERKAIYLSKGYQSPGLQTNHRALQVGLPIGRGGHAIMARGYAKQAHRSAGEEWHPPLAMDPPAPVSRVTLSRARKA